MFTIYRSQKGAVSFGFSISKKKLRISAANSLNPNLSIKNIQKGQKVYDWDNSLYFSLTLEEASELALFLEGKIMLKDNKYHKIHVSDNGTNNFFDLQQNQKSPGTYWLNISNNNGQMKVSMLINIVEANIIKEMCKKLIQESLWLEDKTNYEKYLMYQQQNGGRQQNGYNNYRRNNQQNNNYQNQGWNNQPTNIQQFNNQTPPPPPAINNIQNQNNQTPPPPPPMNNNNNNNNNNNTSNGFFSI